MGLKSCTENLERGVKETVHIKWIILCSTKRVAGSITSGVYEWEVWKIFCIEIGSFNFQSSLVIYRWTWSWEDGVRNSIRRFNTAQGHQDANQKYAKLCMLRVPGWEFIVATGSSPGQVGLMHNARGSFLKISFISFNIACQPKILFYLNMELEKFFYSITIQ